MYPPVALLPALMPLVLSSTAFHTNTAYVTSSCALPVYYNYCPSNCDADGPSPWNILTPTEVAIYIVEDTSFALRFSRTPSFNANNMTNLELYLNTTSQQLSYDLSLVAGNIFVKGGWRMWPVTPPGVNLATFDACVSTTCPGGDLDCPLGADYQWNDPTMTCPEGTDIHFAACAP